jgi:ribonuclease HI
MVVYYAVANGRTNGVFLTWGDCCGSVKGYKNAVYKKFETKKEAEEFIQSNNTNTIQSIQPVENELREPELNIELFAPNYYVYTDGACSNNGKKNATAGIGIFFGEGDPRNVSHKIEGKQTNNTAELTAIIQTYSIIESDLTRGMKVGIMSDSNYAINCITGYGERCSKNNWLVDIPNKELVKRAYELYKDWRSNVQFIHIKAHTNETDIHSIGNDNADKLANMAVGLQKCPYSEKNEKIHLDVPFIQKDEIKRLGGLWDATMKKWYIRPNCKNKDEIMRLFGRE